MSQPGPSNYEDVKLSNLLSPSQALPSVHSRAPFRRQSSMSYGAEYATIGEDDHDITDFNDRDNGLGLQNVQELPQNFKRVPVGSKQSTPELSKSPAFTLTPESSRGNFSQASTYQNTPANNGDGDWAERGSVNQQSGRTSRQDYSSQVDLIGRSHNPPVDCPTDGDILRNPWSSYAVPVLIMAVYSTVFSGVFLFVAFIKPRWGERIGTHGKMSYASATLLSALFSKTVELSFVAVFVCLLGQMLSRRAFMKGSRRAAGVNLSEMTMRLWVTQPGTLITGAESLRHSALSMLGGLTLLATLAATFYTTAAEALAAPKLTFGPTESRVLGGPVTASYANNNYLKLSCETPISMTMDELYEGTTCLQMSYSGQSFHNFQSYLADWSKMAKSGNMSASSSLVGRPLPFAMMYDNTTVTGQWITPSNEDIRLDSLKHSRLVQNVTMAMPHANVFGAARYRDNHILQPTDLNDQGEYEIYASVPAPVINVLCVGMQAAELEPLIYGINGTAKAKVAETVVDSIFRFNNSPSAKPVYLAPQFPKLPLAYNTLVNSTVTYGPDSVWVLASSDPAGIPTSDYVLCSIKSFQYPNCTTKYHAAISGGSLSVHCHDDPENTIPYIQSQPLAPSSIVVPDWKDIAAEWQRALSLSQGITDGNASIARLLSQFVPSYTPGVNTTLPATLPSIGEGLAVLAGSTALMSSQASPFVHYWNYTGLTYFPSSPVIQYFNATVRYKDYSSGRGSQNWQGIFYLVLMAVFAINLFSLGWLTKNFCMDGLITDYTEPQNLFAVALQSQPSTMSFRGSCGGGPQGVMLGRKWRVEMQGTTVAGHDYGEEGGGYGREQQGGTTGGEGREGVQHPHFYVKCPEDDYQDFHAVESVRLQEAKKRRRRPKSMAGWGLGESPAAEQYRRLAG